MPSTDRLRLADIGRVRPEWASCRFYGPAPRPSRHDARHVARHDVTRRSPPVPRAAPTVGTAVGAVLGGVVGNQIGGGRGKDLATVAGAVGGGYAGHQVQKGMQERDTYVVQAQRCRTVGKPVERVVGYDVRYTISGKPGTVRMDHAPADRIPVRDGRLVLDTPAGEAASGRS